MNKNYLNWLNDTEVNQFLEIRHNIPQSAADLESFVQQALHDQFNYLYGIFYKNLHVGNIKLSVDRHYPRADIGLIIGERDCWGKGIAAESIKLISNFGFQNLGLVKITAGAYEPNIGSIKAFLKNDFIIEAKLAKQYRLDGGELVDAVLLAKFRD